MSFDFKRTIYVLVCFVHGRMVQMRAYEDEAYAQRIAARLNKGGNAFDVLELDYRGWL